ncbi:uncharacterized protein LOC127805813 [Diospyros lotus]|uniref:uncharacterized protein LOC127805813 n=1 Tax=Diospyros lotus TaxID=55363 RepID=UPI00225A68FD|nr:uncharacterized protein LOC127805813 [Diospyros lotus]
MRPSLLLSILLFSILISNVQGIRFNKEFLSAWKNKLQESREAKAGSKGDIEIEEAIHHCKDEHCSSSPSGSNRKLMASAKSNPTSSTTISKNDKGKPKSTTDGLGGKDQESLPLNSSPDSKHRKAATEHYPDILDIAGMDYTPAKRKPPIHN